MEKKNDKISIVDIIALGLVACVYILAYCTGLLH